MTPKEKAKDLIDKFYQEAPLDEIKFYSNDVMAKQCALIAVEEIIESHYYALSGIKPMIYEYWNEVKQEIQKL
jgi:hypothetical protein